MKTGFVLSFVFLTIAAISVFAESEPDPFSPNLYARLGISAKATEEQIKTAYRRLAQQYHPDKNKSPDAEEIFKKVKEAYEILKDKSLRRQFDSFRNERDKHFGDADPSPGTTRLSDPSGFDYVAEHEKLKDIKKKYPNLAAFVDYVIKSSILPRLPDRPGIYYLPDYEFYLWPSDIPLIKEMLETKNPFLLRQAAYYMMTLPGWENHEEVIQEVIALNIPFVNRLTAEFVYSPHWVTPQGARLLNQMIDLGYGDQAARALGLAGFEIVYPDGRRERTKSWYELPEGLEVMKRLIVKADQTTLDRLELFHFSKDKEPWSQAMAKDPLFKDVPYMSLRYIKPILDELAKDACQGPLLGLSSPKNERAALPAPKKKGVSKPKSKGKPKSTGKK